MGFFLHCSTLLCPEMCLFANRSSYSAYIMVLLKLTFVLHSFLHCHEGDNLQYTRYCFDVRLGQVQYWQRCSLYYSLLGMLLKVLRSRTNVYSNYLSSHNIHLAMWSPDTHTILTSFLKYCSSLAISISLNFPPADLHIWHALIRNELCTWP